MIRYYSSSIVFQEVPDEITLALEITSCPHRCPECHSPWLREDKGIELDEEECDKLIREHPGITCLCFMGGDSDHGRIAVLCDYIRKSFKLKTAMYSGDEVIDQNLVPYLDYYKIGPYVKEKGPLNAATTNQRFYRVKDSELVDITNLFISKR